MRSPDPGARHHEETLLQAAAAALRETPASSPATGPLPAAVAIGLPAGAVLAGPIPVRIDLQSTVELTIRAQAGDQLALEALCLRCLKSLSRYAAGRLPPAIRGMVETQDIVLEAVQRGMYRLGEFEIRHPGALIAFMRRILKNLIVDYLRSAIRLPLQVSLDDQQADRGQSPLEQVLDAEQLEMYEAALERLKPRDASLVTLKIEEQLSYDEIAIELGFPTANAARVAAKRAVLRLAHEMSRLSRAGNRPVIGHGPTQMRDAS